MKILLVTTVLFLGFLISSCTTGKNWNETKIENTLDTYEEFLFNNPETEHKDSVLLLIRELDWQFAKTSNKVAILDSFLLKYPENKEYKDSVSVLKPMLAWEEAVEENTVDIYRKFMDDYPESQNCDGAKRKIEKIKWEEVKKINKKEDYIEFLADVSLKNYIDSIDIKFEFKDFVGYAVSFDFKEKTKGGDVYIRMIFNFKPGGKLIGVFKGDQEGENYSAGWSGEFKGMYDESGIRNLTKRITDFSDVTDFEPEPWTKEYLKYSKDKQALYSKERSYKLVEIDRIKK